MQTLESVPHAALDGVFWRTGDGGDLLKRKVCHLSQQKYLALLSRKRVERRHDLDLDFVGDRAPLGRRTRVRIGHLVAERRALPVFMGLTLIE